MRPELGSATIQVWARRKASGEAARDAHRAALQAETDELLRSVRGLPPKPWLRETIRRLWRREKEDK